MRHLLFALAACASSSPTVVRDGGLELQMANCPSALWTATTQVTDLPDGVEVAVTVSDPASHQRLIALADHHAGVREPTGARMHSGQHGGPGYNGHCPIVHNGTVVTYVPIHHGVKFHVRAVAVDVELLRRETRTRVAGLPRWIAN